MLRTVGVIALVGAAIVAGASQDAGLRARYTKQEVEIPMRDGVTLFTSIYAPVDVGTDAPILLQRTPYGVGPYGPDAYRSSLGPSPVLESDGYIWVFQDVRGRFKSGGEFVEMRPHHDTRGPKDVDESSDTYDTVAWLIEHVPHNNGRVGLSGVSYPGFYAAAALPGAHPALKAVSPQAPIADLFLGDDSYHNGAFMLAANFSFYRGFYPRANGPSARETNPPFQYGTNDGYAFYLGLGGLRSESPKQMPAGNGYWDDNLLHTTYDEFWKARAIAPHLKGVAPAVMTVGGWFDAEDLQGALRIYSAVERQNPGASNRLVMGPWSHGAWARGDGDRLGSLAFGAKTGTDYRARYERPFFEHYLRDVPLPDAPEAAMFVTGRNAWESFEHWPPAAAKARTFYFQADRGLSETKPSTGDAEGRDEYVSDPTKPAPYLATSPTGMRRDYMTEDQRFAAARPDVLVYQTPPLAADLTLAGPIKVSLQVSTTGTDADWVVKLVDVYPDDASAAPLGSTGEKLAGYQQLVRGEPFRGKFRESFEKPTPFVPGKPATIAFDMPDVAHTFKQGHRVMVQVQSAWFPLIDRNPQVFMDIPLAKPEDFKVATQRVYRSKKLASSITVLAIE